ncbi:MAG: tRNA lysidine(34) synthetase TilS, partial [Bacteroidaceae bacterium]|nr:tRNA lysidine(34) synthetase TilS [Bacteroidaceae bacterium]
MKLEKKVANFIKRNQLLDARSTVLVAFSGGADSVALLRILLQLGYDCCVAHCNFKLRGAESDRDESFVRSVCGQLSVPCRVATFDTRNYAQEHKISIEMAARELRYGFFYQLLDELKMDVVAVAHHSSDQAETVLLNLLRGSGLQGLRGMKPQHDRIVRPLLCCSKTEIFQYLEELKQPFVTDSSNLTDEPLRNKIRLHVLPMLEKINPRAETAVCRSASYLSQAEDLLNKAVTEEFNIYKVGENACRRQIL